MRVAAIQMDAVFANVNANLLRAEKLICEAAKMNMELVLILILMLGTLSILLQKNTTLKQPYHTIGKLQMFFVDTIK